MCRRNAIQVLIPKYGLESAIMLPAKSAFVFDEDTCSLRVATGASAGLQLFMFDAVRVRLELVSTNAEQHHRLQLKLIEPKIDGFSVESAVVISSATENDLP